jgi:hypothetical protein
VEGVFYSYSEGFIRTVNGKVVQKGDLVNSTVDVSLLENGVYFVRIEQNGEVLGGRKVLVE